MKDLDLFSKMGFGIVLLVALAISWWSLFTLALGFGMPTILAIGVSAAFDGAALFLAGMTSKFTRNGDNPFVPKTATYLMIGVSVLLNVLHANALSLGVSGMIMFGAASLIAGIIFEVYLRYIHRQVLKESGRVLERLPLTGKMAFLFHPIVTMRVHNKALKKRLYQGALTVSDFDDKDEIFAKRQKTKTEDKPKTIKATAERQDKGQVTETKTKELVLVKTPETQMKDMSIAKLVAHFRGQGIEDRQILREEISKIKGEDIPLNTINKTVSRLNKSIAA